ncbi:hypothetical protein AGMMS49525_13230 [Bacteroidia bacterium]|nr:hypothetical protein AGMMS49525_13230 [Bacteroidia bacterium]
MNTKTSSELEELEILENKKFLQLWNAGRIEEALATTTWMTVEECRRSCHEAIDEARKILAERHAENARNMSDLALIRL